MGTNFVYRFKLFVNFIFRLQFIKKTISDTRNIQENLSSRVNFVVFQTTFSRRLPIKLYREVVDFRERNKEILFETYSNTQMSEWMSENFANELILDAFQDAKFGVMKSDIFKYCFAYRNGGVSLDITKNISSSLISIFDLVENELVLTQERQEIYSEKELSSWFMSKKLEPNLFVNWCFGVQARHPSMHFVIKQIEDNYLQMRNKIYGDVKQAIWKGTGPIAFNRGIMSYLGSSNESNVEIIGKDFGELDWPKFKSSIYLNSTRKHYTEFNNKVIWGKAPA